ncbi:hypothetical protein EON65_54835 [archaeon]|nr:MAG: hypothetical protein EON65_54835 [archaeon]
MLGDSQIFATTMSSVNLLHVLLLHFIAVLEFFFANFLVSALTQGWRLGVVGWGVEPELSLFIVRTLAYWDLLFGGGACRSSPCK